MSDGSITIRAHGLWYFDRSRQAIYWLDGNAKPDLPRPERDVMIALLKYALDRYEIQDQA